MSLLLTAPPPSPPRPDLTPSPVLAVVLLGAGSPPTDHLAAALAEARLRPDAVTVAALGPAEEAAASALVADLTQRGLRAEEVEVPARRSLRLQALAAVGASDLDALFGDRAPRALLWFLTPGTLPEADALHRLCEEYLRSPSVGAVGPKHLDAEDPSLIRSLGIHATRTGRLVPHPAPGRPDQGQLDTSTDVLAVPLTGMLIEAGLLAGLDGWEVARADVAADLDLGWRAQRAGRRVVVAPRARMLTIPGVAVAVGDTGVRRRAARLVALTQASGWAVLPLAVWIALSALVTGALLLLLKRPRAAAWEVAQLGALRPWTIARSRWRHRGDATVARTHLRSLFVPGRAILRGMADAAHDAVFPPRAPIGNAAHDLTPRSLVGRIARHPLLLAPLAVLLATLVAARTLPGARPRSLSDGLVGGALPGGRADAAALWSTWVDSWRGAGLGGASSGEPVNGLLAFLAAVVERVPFMNVASSGGTAVALILLLGMPCAAISAYLAARLLTRQVWPRALAAAAWAANPVAVAAIGQGRVGAVIALVVLPLAAAGLALTAGRAGTATSAFATGLALAVLGAGAPVLLVLAAVVLLGVLVFVRGARGRALAAMLTAAGLQAPWILDAIVDPRRALAGPGLVTSGDPAGSWGWWALGALPLVVLGVVALGGRSPGRDSRSVLAGVAAVGLVGFALGRGVDLGDGLRPWLPLLLLLPILAVAAASLLLPTPRHWALGVAATTLVGALAVGGLGSALRTEVDPRPVVAIDQADRFFGTRTLVAELTPSGPARYRFLSRESSGLLRSLPEALPADAQAAPEVATILAGGAQVTATLTAYAVDVLALHGTVPPALSERLDTRDGLTRMGAPTGWSMWRVTPTDAVASTVAPPRIAVVGSGIVAVAVTGQSAATKAEVDVAAAGRLVIAMPPQWSEHAVVRIDGAIVQPRSGNGPPSYPVSAGRHTVEVAVGWSHPWVRQLSLAWLGVVLFLAIPFGTRRSRTGVRYD